MPAHLQDVNGIYLRCFSCITDCQPSFAERFDRAWSMEWWYEKFANCQQWFCSGTKILKKYADQNFTFRNFILQHIAEFQYCRLNAFGCYCLLSVEHWCNSRTYPTAVQDSLGDFSKDNHKNGCWSWPIHRPESVS